MAPININVGTDEHKLKFVNFKVKLKLCWSLSMKIVIFIIFIVITCSLRYNRDCVAGASDDLDGC